MSAKPNGQAGPVVVDRSTPESRRRYVEDRLGAAVAHWDQRDFDRCYWSIHFGAINEAAKRLAGVR